MLDLSIGAKARARRSMHAVRFARCRFIVLVAFSCLSGSANESFTISYLATFLLVAPPQHLVASTSGEYSHTFIRNVMTSCSAIQISKCLPYLDDCLSIQSELSRPLLVCLPVGLLESDFVIINGWLYSSIYVDSTRHDRVILWFKLPQVD